jgi:putative spermidine/putrescine transport system permease protein
LPPSYRSTNLLPRCFVTAQRTQTLPVVMYNYVREYADPSMAALSVIYIIATAALLTFANTFSRPQ